MYDNSEYINQKKDIKENLSLLFDEYRKIISKNKETLTNEYLISKYIKKREEFIFKKDLYKILELKNNEEILSLENDLKNTIDESKKQEIKRNINNKKRKILEIKKIFILLSCKTLNDMRKSLEKKRENGISEQKYNKTKIEIDILTKINELIDLNVERRLQELQ